MTKKISYPCPCGGTVEWKKEKVMQEGIDCGLMDIETCKKCGEEYLPEESMLVIEQKLKEAGLWGMERKEIKFWKSGNSVIMRLPTEMAHQLGLKNIKKGYVYKDGKNKLATEF